MKWMAMAAALLALEACMPAEARQGGTIRSIAHYDLELPTDYLLKNVSPALGDFDLYEVVRKTSPHSKLTLYIGNHPDFPHLNWAGKPRQESKDGCVVKEFPYSPRTKQMEGVLVFSGLRYKDSPQSPYSQVHYIAANVTAEEASELGKIVRSVRVVRPHLE